MDRRRKIPDFFGDDRSKPEKFQENGNRRRRNGRFFCEDGDHKNIKHGNAVLP